MRNLIIQSKLLTDIKLILIALILLLIVLQPINCQIAIATSGANATSNYGSVSYTIGQVVFNTYSGIDGSIAQGVQQPYEISVVTGVSEQSALKLNCSVYPNPTNDKVVLRIENYFDNNMEYEIYNSEAFLVKKDKIINSETKIDMLELIPAVYILKIIENDLPVVNFKIIKNF